MCSPLAAVAAVLAVAGTTSTIVGKNQAEKAQRSAVNRENDRQSMYQREAMGIFDNSLQGSTRESHDKSINDKTDIRAAKYEGAAKDFDPNTDFLSGQGGAPDAVKNAIIGAMNKAATEGREEGRRKAILDAWGDTMLSTATRNQRNADRIGMVNNFSRASSMILPLELQAALSKGSGWRTAGNIMSGLGTVAGMGAGMGAGPSWGDIFGPSYAAAANNAYLAPDIGGAAGYGFGM